ncbi:fatty acid--CoA ligase family protein [Flavitalea sp. BT771]|uniref:class I adenylate-forming enzyme family protein n=1 Tax=Flavitalea sp. BT771 TaxID=3063329 RepID=UPI0026E2DEF9|nr:fatty acid--CoA ligase family protein [Flavitalea sp. BT771]MDO6431635.1 fatty acid--CoA ligase family protein [Flavitalea sp. BT771]MDV6220543.1 fatty acid--CoA ligase family protein [Flavitalea sp. BT771]
MLIIPPDAGARRLRDDHAIISYADVPQLLKDLELFFKTNDEQQIHCLALTAENSITRVLVLLYLLSARVNFYLQSPHMTSGGSAPPFCDLLLSVGDDPFSMGQTLELRRNPAHAGKGNAFIPGNGSVLFSSSGSSGRPKYIHYRQEMLIRNAYGGVKRFGFRQQSRVLVPVPVGHMYGLGVGLLPALLCGAELCLIERNNVVKFLDRMSSFLPDITLITPTVAKMLLTLGKAIPAKSIYITAGEKIRQDTWRNFTSAYGPLINLYGCTEMGAIATTPVDDSLQERSEGILQPLDEVEVKIAGGEKGEVLCRHPAGFECYVDSKGDRVPSPAAADGWYATRDMGADAGDGRFTVMGRMDNCINRAGFLISLDEVASMLENMFPEISQAVVFEQEEENGLVTGLTAVCELAKGYELEEGLARKRCRSGMHSHFVPDIIHIVQDMARLQNGKPDRISLIDQYKTIVKNKNQRS